MNPAEKVKTILDTLTIPLSKDDPFGQGGRNLKFDGSCFDLRSITFQGFVNRISTFKPEDWSSDPNAAIFLSKYGFKAVSGSKVCCCCCGIEVDVGVFLRNRDVLRTIAIQSHKQYCRWLHVSTPEEYFCIPKNPYRGLQDLKVTFTDMMTFQTSIPLIVKDNWVKMGISEAFMMSVLNFLEQTYSDILASCVVLSLCGWVKRNEKSLQCNFCQRVVGVWSFISDNVTRSLPVERPSKHSRVISLLYSEIRGSMELSEDSEVVEVNCEGTPDSTVEPPSVEAPSEEPPSEEPPSEEPPSEEPPSEEPPSEEPPSEEPPSEEPPSVEPPSEEPPSEEPSSVEPPSEETQSMETSFTEMPSAEMLSVEIPSAETPSVEIPSAESLSMEHHPVKPPAVTHVKHAVKPPRVKPPRVKPPRVEPPLVEPLRVAPPCVEPTPMKPTPLEPSSEEPEIVYEGTTKRNQGGPSSVRENKSMLKDPELPPYYPNMMAGSDLELTTRMRNEAIPGNQSAWTRLCEKYRLWRGDSSREWPQPGSSRQNESSRTKKSKPYLLKTREKAIDCLNRSQNKSTSNVQVKITVNTNTTELHVCGNVGNVYEARRDFYGDERDAYGVGRDAHGVGRDAHGVGRDAYGVGRDTYGIGREAYGVGRDAYGVGRDAYGVGRDAYGVGRDAYGVGRDAYGVGREVYGVGSEVYGVGSEVYGVGSEVYGVGSEVYGVGSEVYGVGSEVYGVGSEAYVVGSEAYVVGSEAYAVGSEAYAVGRGAYGVGREAYGFANEAYGVGREAHPVGREAHPVGREAHPVGREAHPVGREAHPVGREAHPVGREAHPVGREAHPVGREAHPVGREAHPVGREAHPVGREAHSVAREAHTVERKAPGVGRKDPGVGRDAHRDGSQVHRDGREAHRDGREAHRDGRGIYRDGRETHRDGRETHRDGRETHRDGRETHRDGRETHRDGRETHRDGREAHRDGREAHRDGREAHRDGRETHRDGRETHRDGRETHRDGRETHRDGRETHRDGREAHKDGREAHKDGREAHKDGRDAPRDGRVAYSDEGNVYGDEGEGYGEEEDYGEEEGYGEEEEWYGEEEEWYGEEEEWYGEEEEEWYEEEGYEGEENEEGYGEEAGYGGEQDIHDAETETDTDYARKGPSDFSSECISDKAKKQSNVEFKSNNNGASKDENGFYSTEPNVREETYSQSIKSVNSSLEQDTIVISSGSEKRSSNNSCLSVGEESVSRDTVAEKKSSPCLQTVRKSRMKCVVKLKKLDPNVICNACNISTAQLKQSENSCVPAKGHDESCGNSDGRRKRKRVPENERNGDPNDPGLLPRLPSQMEPVHFTRSKKKELEMMLNERSKSAEVPPSKDTVTEVIEILSSEGEAASEGESKNHMQEQEDNDKDSDTVNDNTCTTVGLENDPVIPTEYEDNTDLNPVICSIVGNAEIRDISGPIIVSAESIYEEDYIEGGGRKYVNGCRTKSHIYNDISDNDSPIVSSPEKSAHSNTERSYEASEETSAAEDSEESPRRKRRRILTDKDSDRVNSVPELDDFINNLPATYFNPELEHRYWCVWRLHVAECMKDCCGWQKGWELYMTAIQEGLKLLNAKKTAVSEVENNALGCLADIVSLTHTQKK